MEDLNPSQLSTRLQEIISSFVSLSTHVEKRIQILKEKEDHSEEVKKKMEESIAKANSQINLNIGGRKFSASKSTFLSIPDTYFTAMLSSDRWKPDDKGRYFIDRDYTHFPRIMDYLRTGTLDVNGLDKKDLKKLKVELDYYQIPSPSQRQLYGSIPLQWNPKMKGDDMELFDNNKTVVMNRLGWNAVLGTRSVTSYSIKVIRANGGVMVGMAPRTIQLNSPNYRSCGWYLNVNDGTVYSKDGSDSYTSPVEEGSIVKVNHDKQQRTISFSVDGRDKGVAFRNIPDYVDLYPCTEIFQKSSSVSLVKFIINE